MAYIDKDLLLKDISESVVFSVRSGFISPEMRGARKVIDRIENAPTADVVEVVRCEKCKNLTVHNSPTLYAYCEKTHFRFEPFQTDTRTHFCSYGERQTNQTTEIKHNSLCETKTYKR